MSLRAAVNAKCRWCIVDELAAGSGATGARLRRETRNLTRDRNRGPRRHPRVNSCPPVCAEHFNRRDGAPGCMAAATMRGPCLACSGIGTVAGGARCWPCFGTGELMRCRLHDFAALQSFRRRNRARDLCRCGAAPTPGFVTCPRCRAVDTARRRRQRAAVRDVPDRTLYAAAREPRRDSPLDRELRRRVRVLPLELRIYGPLGLLLPSDAEMRRIDHRERTAPAQSMPGFDALSERLQAFVRALVENGGNRTAAALAAGYGAVSAARGGRAASVAGCRIGKRPYIIAAVREYRARRRDRERQIEVLAGELERHGKARARREAIEATVATVALLADRAGPQSSAARLLRRFRHEPVSRARGRCRCGAPVSEGFASCEPCRARERGRGQHRRAVNGRRINAWRRAHRHKQRIRRRAA